MKNDNKPQVIDILYIARIFLGYWKLLAVSGFIFVAIGVLYLKFASRTYTVFAKIALRTEQVRSGGGSSNAYVNVNDMMNQEKEFANEMSFLASSPQIKSVIRDMNLFTSYYIKEDKIPKELPFSFINIYLSSPFIVVVDENSPQPINTLFYLNIIDDQKFTLNAHENEAVLYYPGTELGGEGKFHFSIGGTYNFGETITTKHCSFRILLNSNYKSEEYQGKDLFFRFNSIENLAYAFQEALTTGNSFHESSIAELTFTWENLELAEDFLTQLINKYIDKNLEKKNYNANNTIEYIDRQLENILGTLGQSEQQLQNFRTSRDVMNIDEKVSSLSSQMDAYEQTRDILQTRYNYLSDLNELLSLYTDYSTFIAPSMVGMSDATLATLIQELTTLSTERQNLISTNQLRNPRIKTLEANIATIKKVISDNVAFNLTSSSNELDEINKRIAKLNRELSTLPQTQRQLFGLEREFNINDAVYTSLLDKRIQAQIIKASNLPDCEIIEPVRYLNVASPSPKKVGIIAIFLGGFLPSIYIIFINFLSPYIRTKEELSVYNSLPGIGNIPRNDNKLDNVIINYPQSPIAEKFRSIRSNLIYYLLGETHKTILVTSTLPGEGKSFISLNLALSFASVQSKTVLLGFDLRKNNPLLQELKVNGQIGLSSYLINKASLDEITIKTPYPNLDFISNGQIPPDPVALMSSKTIGRLFEALKLKYDYIIVDTPPFGLVTDPFLLMQFSDINLYVIRLGTITKKALKQSMEDLETRKVEHLYSIQNDLTNIDKAYNRSYYNVNAKRNFFGRILSKFNL